MRRRGQAQGREALEQRLGGERVWRGIWRERGGVCTPLSDNGV